MNYIRKHTSVILTLLPVLVLVFPQIVAAGTWGEEILWGIVNGVFGSLLGLAGMLLDTSITQFVVGFGDRFLNSGVGVAVEQLWVAVRDIFNLTFIFGLVYIGFKMILNSDDSGTRRWLVHLIMAALLVNFSLFITKFIVDISNVTATQIIDGGFTKQADGDVDVTKSFMDNLGVTSIWADGSSDIPQGASYSYIFGAAIVFIVAAFVFAAGAFMLIIRYAALCLYMIMSPLMFLGWVFPNLQSYTSEYWRGFLGKAFYAPIYVLLLYFSNIVIGAFYGSNGSLGSGGRPQFYEVFTANGQQIINNNTFEATIPPFILCCVFLLSSVVVAQKLGVNGAGAVMRVGNDLRGRVQRTVTNTAGGTARFAAAQTAGRGTRYMSNKVGGSLERQLNKLQAKGGVAGSFASMPGVDRFARSGFSTMQNAKFGLGTTIADDQKATNMISDRNKRYTDRANAQADYDTALNANNAQGMLDAKNALGAQVRRMSNDELLAMNTPELSRTEFATHLSDAQIKAMQDSGNFSNDDIGAIKNARNAGTFTEVFQSLDQGAQSADDLNTAFTNLAKTIGGLSNERLEGFGVNLTNPSGKLNDPRVAMHLSEKQIDHLKSSGKFDGAQIQQITNAREQGLQAMAQGTQTTVGLVGSATPAASATDYDANFVEKQRQNLMNRGPKESGSLPVSLFTEEKMAQYITPQIMEERMRNGNISNADLDTIRKNIDDYIASIYGTSSGTQVINTWQGWKNKSPVYAAQLGLTTI